MVTKLHGANKMNISKKTLPNKICRICMMASDGSKDAISYDLTSRICRMMKICTQINVAINDNLPQLVCNNCYKQLNDTFKFISLAKKSNNRLTKFAKGVVKNRVKSPTGSEISSPETTKEHIKQERVPEKQNDKREIVSNRLNLVEKCEDKNSKYQVVEKCEDKNSKYQVSLTNSPEILEAVGLIKKIILKNDNKFKCKKCDEKFLWGEGYKRHLYSKHNVLSYECRFCRDKFSSRIKLQNHKEAVHSGKNPYRCPECKTHFKTLDNLTVHIRKKHSGKTPFNCKICKNGFQSKEKFLKHVRIHSKKNVPDCPGKNTAKTYNCKNCDKKFKKNSDLVRHGRVHTGEKPFVCNVCKIGFQQAHNLTKHMVIHTKEKAFVCDICNKQFGRNDSMMRHMLVHSIQKPYACTKCKRTFARHSQLEIHVKKNHPRDMEIKNEK